MTIKSFLRSVGAILAGIIVGALLSVGTDAVLEQAGISPSFAEQLKNGPPTWLLVWATVYRTLYTTLGCYITGRLAPNNPMKHAVFVGYLGFFANVAGGIAMWSLGQHWYPFTLAVLSIASGYTAGTYAKSPTHKNR